MSFRHVVPPVLSMKRVVIGGTLSHISKIKCHMCMSQNLMSYFSLVNQIFVVTLRIHLIKKQKQQ